MRNILFYIVALTSALTTSAQQFQGMAVYESKTSTADIEKTLSGNKDLTPDMQKMIQERMKSMFEKTFILNFDKSTSIYKEEEKLDAPGTQAPGMKMMSSMMGGGGTYYKDVKSKTLIVDKEFMGKEFLVKDTLPALEWKLESETRKIGDYTCYKATAVRPASKSDIRNYRRKENTDAKPDAKTNLMEQYDAPKEITVTAWYTPEIPINQGPESYWGLPGLILEVNDGKTVLLCSKIVMNPKDKAEIKAPTNGKVVTQAEYDEIVMKKLEELKQMNGGGGPGMNRIRIGN
ncbi:MAG TPA: GLPGLI family protein [Flavobacterium sp.]|jgi:GLPGLI family protein